MTLNTPTLNRARSPISNWGRLMLSSPANPVPLRFAYQGLAPGNRLDSKAFRAGEVYESNDLTLQTAATYKGSLAANSDISIIVPSDEVKKMLFSPIVQSTRDQNVANALRLRK